METPTSGRMGKKGLSEEGLFKLRLKEKAMPFMKNLKKRVIGQWTAIITSLEQTYAVTDEC